jgi:hypothetical protein
MAVNDVLGQLQALLKKSTPLIETGGEGAQQPLKFTPGQEVQAKVLSTLPNSRFLVLVGDQHLDLNLPRNTQPGDNVELRFVGNQPRPTFILANEAAQPQARGGTVNLSDTARFIGALLDKASQLAARAETPVARSAPVLPGAPADVPQFAQALRSALSQSGLFYESHQAQWVAGQRSLGELLKEPQAQLSEQRAFAAAQRPAEAATPNAASQASEGRAASVPPRAESMPFPPSPTAAAAEQPVETAARPAPVTGMPEASAKESVHPSTAPLLQQQLEALDSRQVIWQGQVWPGQTMQWQIEERDAREGGGTEAANEWQTRLALTLPNLGEVGAQLRLSAQGIRIELSVAEPETGQRLQAAAGQLQAGFERADLTLMQLVVKQNE